MIDAFRDPNEPGDRRMPATTEPTPPHPLRDAKATHRQRLGAAMRRSNILLQAISAAQMQFAAGEDFATVLTGLLHSALAVTTARHVYLCAHMTSGESPTFPPLYLAADNAHSGEEFERLAFISGETLRAGRVLTSVASAEPHANLSPTTRNSAYFLGIPVAVPVAPAQQPAASGSKILLAALTLSGPIEEFDPGLEHLLEPLIATLAQLIVAYRNDLRRRIAEATLEDERAHLIRRVAEDTAAIYDSHVELARTARLKDEFYATMNHELRTPLNAVLLYAESLMAQLPGPLNTRQQRAVGGIHEIAKHILLLINDILDVAKMDAGKLSIDIKPCPIEEVCQSSLRVIAEQAHRKRQTLHYTCSPDLIELDVDDRRLKQMLVNLLSNAVKFTPEGGEIRLDALSDSASNTVSFTVADNGVGISPENIARLFHPFVQLEGQVPHEAGTGLGLFLVRRMAELLGGTVTVASTVTVGSSFTIILPWHHPRPGVTFADLLPGHSTH